MRPFRSQELRNWALLRSRGREGRIMCSHLRASCKQSPSSSPSGGPHSPEPQLTSFPANTPQKSQTTRKDFPQIWGFPQPGSLFKEDGSHLISDNRTQSRAREEKDESPGKGHRHPYRGGGIWLGPMLEQDINDVCVALLGSLVQRCVAIL